jgi:hypothetical protein
MNLWLIPGEATFLEFKLADGSGFLTSHRLIICEHEPGQFETSEPRFFFLKNFQKAQIKGDTLTAHSKTTAKPKLDSP